MTNPLAWPPDPGRSLAMDFLCYHRDRPGSLPCASNSRRSTGRTWTGTRRS
ncbi:hypothetical protein ACFQVA_17760 [Actinomadura keratinilytica]